jgi:flagellar assembly protein FliH
MLSRVVTGAKAQAAERMTFESVAPLLAPRGERRAGAAAVGADTSALEERLRQLEAESNAAQRSAFEAGRRQGEEQGRAAVQPVIEQLTASLTELASLRPQARKRAERDVVELALLIARRTLHRELAVDKGALTALVRVVLERMSRSETYRVTMHPDYARAVQAAVPAAQLARIEFNPDPGCARGTVIFRSPDGIIDASVDSQLEEIGRGLTDRIS